MTIIIYHLLSPWLSSSSLSIMNIIIFHHDYHHDYHHHLPSWLSSAQIPITSTTIHWKSFWSHRNCRQYTIITSYCLYHMLSYCRQYLLIHHLSTTIDHLAALMITYPSTYGVFEEEIINIIDTGKQIGADWVEISCDCDSMIIISIHVYPSIYWYYWSIYPSIYSLHYLSYYLIDNSCMPLCLIHLFIHLSHLSHSLIYLIYVFIHWFIHLFIPLSYLYK